MNKLIGSIVHLLIQIATAMLAYTINVNANSSCPLFWAIVDFFPPFTWIAWIKWFVCHQINMTVIHQTFSFLGN